MSASTASTTASSLPKLQPRIEGKIYTGIAPPNLRGKAIIVAGEATEIPDHPIFPHEIVLKEDALLDHTETLPLKPKDEDYVGPKGESRLLTRHASIMTKDSDGSVIKGVVTTFKDEESQKDSSSTQPTNRKTSDAIRQEVTSEVSDFESTVPFQEAFIHWSLFASPSPLSPAQIMRKSELLNAMTNCKKYTLEAQSTVETLRKNIEQLKEGQESLRAGIKRLEDVMAEEQKKLRVWEEAGEKVDKEYKDHLIELRLLLSR